MLSFISFWICSIPKLTHLINHFIILIPHILIDLQVQGSIFLTRKTITRLLTFIPFSSTVGLCFAFATGLHGKVLAAGGLQGGFCDKRSGLPRARHGCFCATLQCPHNDTAISKAGGTSVKMCLRTGKTPESRGVKEKRARKSPANHQGQWRRGDRRCSRHLSRYPHYSLWRALRRSRWIWPEGTAAHGEPTLEHLLGHSQPLSSRIQLKTRKEQMTLNLIALPWVHWDALMSRVPWITLSVASAHLIFTFAIQSASHIEIMCFCPVTRMIKHSWIYFAIHIYEMVFGRQLAC